MTAVPTFDRFRPVTGPVVERDVRYPDRARIPAATCALVAPALPRLGITRVARQTGLDRIGIPVFSALRPNARTLSSSQGKGIDDDSARASATMEAVEFAFAEKPLLETRATSIAAAEAKGLQVLELTRFLPIGAPLDSRRELRLAQGTCLTSGEPVLVPYDLVDIDETDATIANLSRSSNGLASGNTREEAILHGVCELIERDATTLARLQPDAGPFGRRLDAAALGDGTIDALIKKIRSAGFDFWLFDQTSDIGIPVFQAVIGDPARGYWRHFDLATGYGCHPNAARAAIRAITEAAQTRVTNIAGARDDFRPAEYRLETHASLLRALEGGLPRSELPRGVPEGMSTEAMLCGLERALTAAGVDDPVVVDLGGEAMGIAVTRVFCNGLEDRSTNRHWRPGPRALRLMMMR